MEIELIGYVLTDSLKILSQGILAYLQTVANENIFDFTIMVKNHLESMGIVPQDIKILSVKQETDNDFYQEPKITIEYRCRSQKYGHKLKLKGLSFDKMVDYFGDLYPMKEKAHILRNIEFLEFCKNDEFFSKIKKEIPKLINMEISRLTN